MTCRNQVKNLDDRENTSSVGRAGARYQTRAASQLNRAMPRFRQRRSRGASGNELARQNREIRYIDLTVFMLSQCPVNSPTNGLVVSLKVAKLLGGTR